jgi:hypothetical protein
MGRAANRKRLMRTLKRMGHRMAVAELAVEQSRSGEVAAAVAQSTLAPQTPSRSRRLPEAERSVLERFDGHASLRNKLRAVAQSRSEWAGIPMPLEGERLVVEPRYPFAGLGNIGQEPEEERDWKVRNTFWSTRHRVQVVVFQEANGRVRKGILPRRPQPGEAAAHARLRRSLGRRAGEQCGAHAGHAGGAPPVEAVPPDRQLPRDVQAHGPGLPVPPAAPDGG